MPEMALCPEELCATFPVDWARGCADVVQGFAESRRQTPTCAMTAPLTILLSVKKVPGRRTGKTPRRSFDAD